MNESSPISNPESNAVLLLAPTAPELMATVRILRLRKSGQSNVYDGIVNHAHVVACYTGIGPQRVIAVAEPLIELHKPREIVLMGFAGGLDPDLPVARVMSYRHIMNEDGQFIRLGGSEGNPATPHLDANGPFGSMLLTVRNAVLTVADKRAIHQRTGAAAVDMESYEVGRWAIERKLPFFVLRAISDPAGTALPMRAPQWVKPTGRPRVLRVLADLALLRTSPKELAALKSASEQAADALARWVMNALSAWR